MVLGFGADSHSSLTSRNVRLHLNPVGRLSLGNKNAYSVQQVSCLLDCRFMDILISGCQFLIS